MYSLITGVFFGGLLLVWVVENVIRALSCTNNLHLALTHTRTHALHLLVLLLNVFLLQNLKKTKNNSVHIKLVINV